MSSQMILSKQDAEWFKNWHAWKVEQGLENEIQMRKKKEPFEQEEIFW